MLDFLLVCLLLSVVMRIGQCRPKMKVCINAHGSMEMHFFVAEVGVAGVKGLWRAVEDSGEELLIVFSLGSLHRTLFRCPGIQT